MLAWLDFSSNYSHALIILNWIGVLSNKSKVDSWYTEGESAVDGSTSSNWAWRFHIPECCWSPMISKSVRGNHSDLFINDHNKFTYLSDYPFWNLENCSSIVWACVHGTWWPFRRGHHLPNDHPRAAKKVISQEMKVPSSASPPSRVCHDKSRFLLALESQRGTKLCPAFLFL